MEYQKIRESWRPSDIRVLFIGESRPASGRFFYCGDSTLASCTQEAFANVFQKHFSSTNDFLVYFRDLGCYLEDLSIEPLNKKPPDERAILQVQAIPQLAERIESTSPRAIITIMKGIQPHTEEAARVAGLASVPRYVLPFPRSDSGSDLVYVEGLSGILSNLKQSGALVG